MNKEYNENVRLEDDLYNYVNGKWISEAQIPADQSATGGFYILRDKVEEIMLNEYASLSKTLSNDELLNYSIKLYNKVLNEENRKPGLPYLMKKLALLDDIKCINCFNRSLNTLYSENYPLPFNIGVTEDMMDATKHALALTGPSTILPDTTMYNTEQGNALLNVYRDMATKVLAKLNINTDIIDKALAFDDKISKIVKSSLEWADYIKCYNPYEFKKVCELLGKVNFSNLILSRFKQLPEKVIVFDPKFLDNFNDLFTNNVDLYVAWAKLNTILSNASYISEELRDLAGIYSRAINGVPVMTDINKYAYRLASNYYDEVVGIYYGKKYFGEKAKNDVISIVKNLIISYKNRLSKNTWLSKETIKKAILKLDTMEIKIGYPDKVSELYFKLKYNDDMSLIEIVNRLNEIRSEHSDSKLFEKVDRSLWVMSGNTVNACYNPSFNDITFPAAILQAPFYSIDQTIEENYGGIGSVIGHEISHAFDNNGAQMDELGNIKNWWTKEDYENFQEKTNLMIEEFDGLPLEGEKVDGKLTVSENIADNGGVASSLESLKRVKENPDLKLFFLNYARIWCQKARPEYTKLLLKVDVHGPCYYRANMQVKNFNEFYEAFNIKETDKMYLEPSKRLIIW